ncbi:hypothetical protein Pfo_011912 [Paulownia fortunei]|nr:hypothetical protein Pfo_011912 [Paulownia fortunei]
MTNSTIGQWLILFIFFYFASNPATCSNNETDFLSLLAFKDNVNDPRGALDSWKSNETVHYCSWKGISCGSKHRSRVVSINLDSEGLVGSLSPHLGNLSFLRRISLRNNSFHGPIPPKFGRLRRLVYIEFSNNSFDGGIPRNLSQCQNLYYLNLIDNELTGIIPRELSSLFKLDALGLSDNNFSGTIPPFLGNLTSLTELSSSNCGFQGEIPESLVHLQNLRRLILDDNKLTGTIPSGLFNISTIEIFAVFSNQLQGNIPSDIGFTLPNLRNLGLGDNSFTGVLPVSLTNASFLQYIGLFANSFTGPMPQNLDRFSDLRWLSIWSTNIEDDISFVAALTNCTSLTVLDIYDNFLTCSLPVSIANLTTQLRELGPIPSAIGKLIRLQEINLSTNRFTNELPSSLGNLTLLNTLFATRNNISESIPPSLVNFSSLLELDLPVNNLSGPIPREIMSFITFYLPRSALQCLVGLRISLQWLHLESNSFYGEIPQALSVLSGLEDLSLSRNNFSRPIPRFLAELRLVQLNLSYNKLQGPVPTERVFRNDSAISFEGNTELCGGIPGLKLPPCPSTNPMKKNSSIPLKVLIPVAVSGAIVIAVVVCSYILIQRKTKLSYSDLMRATGGFSEDNVIGSGRFATVYKGILNDGETLVAVKVLNLHVREALKCFLSECNALRVSIDVQGNDFTSLIYQFKANRSLEKWLHQNSEAGNGGQDENIRYLTLMQRLNIAIDITSALEYLRNGTGSAIVHGDLKPSNILLDEDITAHFGDFGLAKVISNISSSFATDESNSIAVKGTVGYIAPEYSMADTVSIQGDIYSYGIPLLEYDHTNLHNFVTTRLPDHAMKTVDPLIVLKEGHMINIGQAQRMHDLVRYWVQNMHHLVG